MRKIFEAISTAITNNVAAIRWIDIDIGQFEMAPPPVSWDAALIGFSSADFINLAGTSQQATVLITIRLGFRLRERTHSKAASQYRAEALGHLDTVEAVHAAVNGLSGDGFTGMTRIGYANEKRPDYRIIQMTYNCLWTTEEDSGLQDWATASEGADLDFCISTDIE